MSVDYQVYCVTCKKARHLGQRMAATFSFGYGSNDRETPPKIMEWIGDHIDCDHELRILWTDDVPDDVEFVHD